MAPYINLRYNQLGLFEIKTYWSVYKQIKLIIYLLMMLFILLTLNSKSPTWLRCYLWLCWVLPRAGIKNDRHPCLCFIDCLGAQQWHWDILSSLNPFCHIPAAQIWHTCQAIRIIFVLEPEPWKKLGNGVNVFLQCIHRDSRMVIRSQWYAGRRC